jgi:uncharacterized protein (DUF305 family)
VPDPVSHPFAAARRALAGAAALVLLLPALAACRPRAAGAGPLPAAPVDAPPPAPLPLPGAAAGDARAGSGATRAAAPGDVRFVGDMLLHHAQALQMVALVPVHSTRPDLQLLAERIAVSQRDEMAMMRDWLVAHGAAVPDTAAEHAHHEGAAMPGMATAGELARLRATSGAEFDRLFLDLMIRHHEGALVMVATLLATPGAGRDSEVFRLATDVDADQRAEIARMRRLRSALGGAPR